MKNLLRNSIFVSLLVAGLGLASCGSNKNEGDTMGTDSDTITTTTTDMDTSIDTMSTTTDTVAPVTDTVTTP